MTESKITESSYYTTGRLNATSDWKATSINKEMLLKYKYLTVGIMPSTGRILGAVTVPIQMVLEGFSIEAPFDTNGDYTANIAYNTSNDVLSYFTGNGGWQCYIALSK